MTDSKIYYVVYRGAKWAATFLTPVGAYTYYKRDPARCMVFKQYVEADGRACMVRWL
jgi:hypothetical protein